MFETTQFSAFLSRCSIIKTQKGWNKFQNIATIKICYATFHLCRDHTVIDMGVYISTKSSYFPLITKLYIINGHETQTYISLHYFSFCMHLCTAVSDSGLEMEK